MNLLESLFSTIEVIIHVVVALDSDTGFRVGLLVLCCILAHGKLCECWRAYSTKQHHFHSHDFDVTCRVDPREPLGVSVFFSDADLVEHFFDVTSKADCSLPELEGNGDSGGSADRHPSTDGHFSFCLLIWQQHQNKLQFAQPLLAKLRNKEGTKWVVALRQPPLKTVLWRIPSGHIQRSWLCTPSQTPVADSFSSAGFAVD